MSNFNDTQGNHQSPRAGYPPLAMARSEDPGEQDWRLEVELHREAGDGLSLHALVERVRGHDELVEQIETTAPRELVITHDGNLLFAYAATRPALESARRSFVSVLDREHVASSLRVSHWDDDRERWQQIDPPPSESEMNAEQAAERTADVVQTRTLVATSGKMIRAEFEQTMSEWAAKLGLECEIVEHPHLLTTQVAFTVTGPKHKIDEFARGLWAEGWATVRAETRVMLSPL